MVEGKSLKCPCCGKELYKLSATDPFARSLIKVAQEHPEDLGELIVGIFSILHNPEAGEPVSEEELKQLGIDPTFL